MGRAGVGKNGPKRESAAHDEVLVLKEKAAGLDTQLRIQQAESRRRLEEANAELRRRIEEQERSRRAALNLMEDAVLARQQAEESEARFRNLFESIDEGFATIRLSFDQSGRVLDFTFLQANPAFSRLTEIEDPVGRTAREAVPGLEDFWFETYGRVARTGESIRFENYAAPLKRWFSVHASRVGGDGSDRVAIIFENITDRKRAEAVVRQSRERLQLASDAMKAVVFDWELSSDKVWRSEEIIDLLGFKATHATGTARWWSSRIHKDDKDRAAKLIGEAIQSRADRFEHEYRIQHRNGSYIWVADRGIFVRNDLGEPVRCVGSVMDITARKELEEKLREHRDQLEIKVQERTMELAEANAVLRRQNEERERAQAERLELLKTLLTAQEDERRRIARNMHDHFGQQITALRLALNAMSTAASDSMKAQLADAQEIAASLDSDINFIVWELRPISLDDLGLEAALEHHAAKWSRQTNIQVDFHACNVDQDRVAPEAQTALYRIAQEALTNITRHSGATRASVLVECTATTLTLIIEDNGKGFDTKRKQASQKGLGLRGMRERAEIAGGTFMVESLATAGTTIYVTVPLIPK